MKMHPSITSDRVAELCELRMTSLENPGLCVACGEDADGCEPDARKYRCEACGAMAVYGAEELLIRMVA